MLDSSSLSKSSLRANQAILDKHPDLLNRKETKSRKARDKLFVSIENGEFDFDEYEDLMGRPASTCFAHLFSFNCLVLTTWFMR